MTARRQILSDMQVLTSVMSDVRRLFSPLVNVRTNCEFQVNFNQCLSKGMVKVMPLLLSTLLNQFVCVCGGGITILVFVPNFRKIKSIFINFGRRSTYSVAIDFFILPRHTFLDSTYPLFRLCFGNKF